LAYEQYMVKGVKWKRRQ